jgi:thiol:disulfide interchange protein DsbD
MSLLRHRLSRLLPALLLAPALAWSQVSDKVRTDEVQAQLVAHAPDGVVGGKPLWLGLLIRHAPQWHTYWKNPGDSGLPTTLQWKLPAGVSAGAIEWPTPQRLPIGPLMNYGYEGTVLLPVPATVASTFAGERLDIGLNAEWLVCKEVCIPQSGEFRLSVPAAASTVAFADAFRRASEQTPHSVDARTTATLDPQALSLTVGGLPAALRGKNLQVFAADAGVIDHAARIAQRWDGDKLALRVPLSAQRSEAPPQLTMVLSSPADKQAVELRFAVANWPPIGATKPAAAPPVEPSAEVTTAGASLWLSLALAFAGGLLLNLMPCVFPVLSLKVIGFAQHAEQRGLRVAGGLAYTAGVVLSFVALAGVLLALRAAGDSLGWGFQLQSPLFVAALALLFALIGFNLLGLFQFAGVLPGRIAALRSRHPVVDHGLTGVLAVAVASPCTAPFMGAALGAALTLPAAQALAVFVALALGMAAPYLAACLWPGLSRALPRPGVWMARFKTAMAFPMFATVVWLVWVLGQQVGIDGAAALLALLVALAFALWVFASFGARPWRGSVARAAAAALVLAVGVWSWPTLQADAVLATDATAAAPAAGAWQPWSPDAFARVRAQGKPVFVDFTAAWCVTCQMNKRMTLSNDRVMDAFRARQVVLMRADWTRRDPAITEALRALGRSGVPVYALYAPNADRPQLLSEILTVSEVRDAVARWPEASGASDNAVVQRHLP